MQLIDQSYGIRKKCFFAGFLLLLLLHLARGADFSYRLYKADIAVALSAGALFGAGVALQYGNDDAPVMRRSDFNAAAVNSFDRPATKMWRPGVDRGGDYGLLVCMAAPAAIGIPMARDHRWSDLLTVAAMYGEATLLTLAFSGFSKAVLTRSRPYLYNTAIDDSEYTRLLGDHDCQRSFFSRHTALAFSSALFLSRTAVDLYGPSKVTSLVWTVSLTAATAVGVTRYVAGQHFPSDVLAGAAVGSLVGYVVPWLHGKGDGGIGVTITRNGVMIELHL